MWFATRQTKRDTLCLPSFNTDFSGNIYDRKLSKNFWRGCGCSAVWNFPISSSRSKVLMFPEHCSKYQKREENRTWTEQMPRWEDMHSWLPCTARKSSCPSSLWRPSRCVHLFYYHNLQLESLSAEMWFVTNSNVGFTEACEGTFHLCILGIILLLEFAS